MKFGKYTKILFGVLSALVLVLTVMEVKSLMDATNKVANTEKESTSLKIGNYEVSKTQSEYEKTLTPELEKTLTSGKDVDIVKGLTQYFISDYFSLRDKPNYNSIGGIGLVYSKNKKAFTTNAINSYYMDLAQYKDAYGEKNLPLVTSVSVKKPKKVDASKVKISDKKSIKVSGVYDVKATWKYEKNEKLDTSKIVNSATVRLVKDSESKNWYVYDISNQQNVALGY